MGVDTKGAVLTACKDVMFVTGLVEKSINQLIRSDYHAAGKPAAGRAEFMQGLCSSTLSTESKLVRISFVYQGESRAISVMFGCDADHWDLAPQCLCLSLGDWGTSKVIMKAVLRSLSCLGEVWLDECDCDDEPLSVFPVPTLSYLDACKLGLERPSCISLMVWYNMWRTNQLANKPEAMLLGMSRSDAERIIDWPYEESRLAIEGMLA